MGEISEVVRERDQAKGMAPELVQVKTETWETAKSRLDAAVVREQMEITLHPTHRYFAALKSSIVRDCYLSPSLSTRKRLDVIRLPARSCSASCFQGWDRWSRSKPCRRFRLV